ncbi:MAG: hypothetical protein ACYDDV_11440 [Methanoregula sp.]
MGDETRKYLPSLAELIDQLTVDQIKIVMYPVKKKQICEEIKRIEHDIDLIMKNNNIVISVEILRSVIILSQTNLHIWHKKDEMQEKPDEYQDLLKLAHQLNGIRNQMKNSIMECTKNSDETGRKTNFNTDGLENWDLCLE